MCMKKFNAEKIIFDKFIAFWTWLISNHIESRMEVDSAYFV